MSLLQRSKYSALYGWGAPLNLIKNPTFDEINFGDTAQLTRLLKIEDIQLFAPMSGDPWLRAGCTLVSEAIADQRCRHQLEPDLDAKRDNVRNAIDLAQALGIVAPKLAILAAVETVNARMRSTLDAAALCSMADCGQITGAIVDGPLAFDNAIWSRAAKDKGITSPVAGQADILIAPDIEAGNMLAKQLQ